jgi:hypothetical protein
MIPGDEINTMQYNILKYNPNIHIALDAPCQMLLPIKAFSPKEVCQIIKKINKHKAPGYDLIRGKIMRRLPKKAIVLLTIIYNSMLRLSYFPVTWKFAQIVMCYPSLENLPMKRPRIVPLACCPSHKKYSKNSYSTELEMTQIS